MPSKKTIQIKPDKTLGFLVWPQGDEWFWFPWRFIRGHRELGNRKGEARTRSWCPTQFRAWLHEHQWDANEAPATFFGPFESASLAAQAAEEWQREFDALSPSDAEAQFHRTDMHYAAVKGVIPSPPAGTGF